MSNELTDVRCPCGAEFQADSYDAGFIAGSGMCQNCDAALPPKDICTCPSGDGSLRWPCPKHPAVEQAGGNERAAFESRAEDAGSDISRDDFGNYVNVYVQTEWEGWQARAALAQPSPASDLDPLNLAPHAEAFNEAPAEALKPGQAEAERPEVVAVMESNGAGGKRLAQRFPIVNVFVGDELMTVAQHGRIVEARWNRAMDLMGEHVARISEKFKAERDDALARVAELEAKLSDPTAVHQWQFSNAWFDGSEEVVLKAGKEGSPIRTLYTAPPAQAQQLHDLDKQCRDDVARALGLRPSQELGFAWSYLLASIKSCGKASEDATQAQHSVPEGWRDMLAELQWHYEPYDDHYHRDQGFYCPVCGGEKDEGHKQGCNLAELLAAAPGKEG